MNTYTQKQINTLVAAGIDLNEFFGATTGATTAPAPAQEATPKTKAPKKAADAPVVLTRARWKAIRTTKKGVVRAKFAGLTREQALEAGLLPGYVLPSGDMRAVLSAHEA